MSDPFVKYAGLGVQFAATILAFTGAGWWIDSKLGSRPWFLIGGMILGFAGGMISLVRKVPPVRGTLAEDPDDEGASGAPRPPDEHR